ncbi:MAG: hypothetical protein R2849_16370 [Thermomicrobiales bacterium]
MFDPGLRSEPRITMDTECDITAGLSSTNFTNLSATEWEFVGVLIGPKTLGDIAAELEWSGQQVLGMAKELVARGVITLRTPTGVLMTSTTSLLRDPAEMPVPA